MSRLLENLNPAQREAVTTTDGPLLIIAGAGSGKTRVLVQRLSYILHQRLADPYQIMAVTFTNKAAGEMKDRVAALLGGNIPEMNVSTFHSFCARLLRREADKLGFNHSFTIFDTSDSITLVKNCIAELKLSTSQFTPKAQLRKISNAKNQLVSPEDFTASASGYFEECTSKIYTLYDKRLSMCNGMDFDDLLFKTVMLLRNDKDVGRHYRQRFRYLMVDEFQDTNRVQYLLLKNLIGEHRNICAVGDEDQSIYGWRGADIRNILDFEKDFPDTRLIKLEQNYRSTKTILDAASSVIGNNEARKDKNLFSEIEGGEKLRLLLVDSAADEAIHVVNNIEEQQAATDLKNMAVLYRTNAQSRAFEEHLRRHNLPYQIIGGITFYQRKEIKNLLAYLKLLNNLRDDVSFERIINYPKRGLGQKTVAQIVSLARQNSISCYEATCRAENTPELSGRWRLIEPFVSLIEKYRAKKDSVPVDILTRELVDELKLFEELQSDDEIIGQTRIENIEAFIEGTVEYASANGEATLDNYLAEISLFTDIDQYSEIENKVTLMTIHSAKGLEFDMIFMVGLEENLFPLERSISDPMQLEEERRLFYVGATRTRKKLFLSSASTRFRMGQSRSMPSRFIGEIPNELVET
ncbi:MAG: UvrD-helicase domain-containing protein, partial [candidate division Zixibacteria bacterium]|nr:UvrD-helicase domain-containing protein [candidate division Zixibacteria bacterium]